MHQSSPSGAFLLPTAEIFAKEHPLCTRILPDIANMSSVLGNACSTIVHMVGMPKPVQNFADFLGAFGTKFFLLVNASVNTIENLLRHNYLSAFGYSLDNLIALFVPQEHTFLARGLSSGTYHLSNSLSVINGNRASFNSWTDHVNHIFEALKEFGKSVVNQKLLVNLFDSEKSLVGILGGFLSIGGPLTYPLFGKKIASSIRDLGGALKSINYVNPGHIKEGRKLFFASGLMQVGAALADFIVNHVPKLKPTLVPISLGLDGLAKYVLRRSVNSGELGMV